MLCACVRLSFIAGIRKLLNMYINLIFRGFILRLPMMKVHPLAWPHWGLCRVAAGPAPRGSLPPPLRRPLPPPAAWTVGGSASSRAPLSLPPTDLRSHGLASPSSANSLSARTPEGQTGRPVLGEFAGSARGPGRLCPRRRRAHLMCYSGGRR